MWMAAIKPTVEWAYLSYPTFLESTSKSADRGADLHMSDYRNLSYAQTTARAIQSEMFRESDYFKMVRYNTLG